MTELKQYELAQDFKRLQERNEKLEKMAFHYTPEEWDTMMRMVARLQEQLKEANDVIADLSEYPPINPSTRELSFALNRYNAKKYLEKWSVK